MSDSPVTLVQPFAVIQCQYTLPEVREAMKVARRRVYKTSWWLWVVYIAILVLGGFGTLVVSAMLGPKTPPATQPTAGDGDSPWLFFVPWLGYLAVIFLFLRFYNKWIARRNLDRPGPLRRPHTFEFRPDGVLVREPFSSHHYLWQAFPRYLETPRLYLLFVSEYATHIVPKRCFANPMEVDRFREVLRMMIPDQLPRDGFQVVPVANLAPAAHERGIGG